MTGPFPFPAYDGFMTGVKVGPDMDILVDNTGDPVVDPISGTTVGIPSQSYSRVFMAVASNESETGPVSIFSGEHICDSLGFSLVDDNGFSIGLAPVWVDRMVWSGETEDITYADYP